MSVALAALLLVQPSPDIQATPSTDEPKVCRRIESWSRNMTRVKSTVCATKMEWKQYRRWLNKQDRDSFPISGR